MAEDTELLREIRDLLLLIAEPALSQRDERLRGALLKIVGQSSQRAEAVAMMDGTRSQATIRTDCGMDKGNFSRFLKSLREQKLIGPDDGNPKLTFPAPPSLIDSSRKS